MEGREREGREREIFQLNICLVQIMEGEREGRDFKTKLLFFYPYNIKIVSQF